MHRNNEHSRITDLLARKAEKIQISRLRKRVLDIIRCNFQQLPNVRGAVAKWIGAEEM